MPVIWNQKIKFANGMITKYGGPAALRRVGSADRPCIAAIVAFQPMERMGKITNPEDRKALVSVLAPDGSLITLPDYEQDRLVTFIPYTNPPVEWQEWKIFEPAGQVGSAGVPVFWRLSVRR